MQGEIVNIDRYPQGDILKLENTAGPELVITNPAGARLLIQGVWAEFLLRLSYRITTVAPTIAKDLMVHLRHGIPFTGWTIRDNVHHEDKIHQFVIGRGNEPGYMVLMSAVLNIPTPFVEIGVSNPQLGPDRPNLYLIKDRLLVLPMTTAHVGISHTGRPDSGSMRDISQTLLRALETHPATHIPDSPIAGKVNP